MRSINFLIHPFFSLMQAQLKFPRAMNFPYLSALKLVILAVILSSQNVFLGAESATLSTDREALLSFKSLISMEPPNALSTWDPNSSPCNWTGVVCNKLRQRVVELDLSDMGITGSISPHIGNLSFLRSLQLQHNRFTGTLPDQLGNLFRLRIMNISSNSVEGAIPRNISRCRELRIIDMMQNEISGRIPEELGELAELQVLNLGRNQLSGAIPPSIANVSSLTVLILGTNTIGGLISSDLSHLRNLKQLDLTINNITGTIPPSIWNMSSLVNLAVASNDLWGDLPNDVGVTLPNLLIFNFCINKFTGTIPGSLHNLTKIRVIRMAHNLLHGTVPPGLGNLPDLQMYNIGFNEIISSGESGLDFITSLTNSTHLHFLAIDGNLLEGIIPESIGNLSKVLSSLYMGRNLIHGSIPASIGLLSGLTLLNLSYNSISGQIPQEMAQLEKLQMLGLAGNRISGIIPSSLGNFQKLNDIDLSRNEFVGSIPTSFGNFRYLFSMDLSNNKLNGGIPKEILNLSSLSTFLKLSNNFLSGPLPQEVGFLENVGTIDLSSNRLSGNIPPSIAKCQSLEKLFMANNMFSGPIPDTLVKVKGLEILDLSSNQLSGSVPPGLQNLSLQFLNLSFNNLEGEIPTGGIFSNISKVHLEGNPKLCFHSACQNSGGGGRVRLILVRVIIAIVALLALCFTVGLLFYIRKSKANVMASFESFKRQHQIVSYDELRLATGNFNQENQIGRGSFGAVYKGYLGEGIAVAVKVLDTQINGSWKSFFAECAALRNTRHRNLLKVITTCSSVDFRNMEFLALVYEFMSNGSLDDWINGKRRKSDGEGLDIVDRVNVASDVACAINYLHHECESPMVHCDLKPSNVLLDEDMVAKVGDFGLAKLLIARTGTQSSTNVLKGSIGYIPPEYGLGEKPSAAGDVYSFGIMLLELFTGKKPTHESFVGGINLKKWVQLAFPNNMEQVLDPELLSEIENFGCDDQSISLEIRCDCLKTVVGIALSCTSDSPTERISMKEVYRKLQCVKEDLLKPDVTEKNKFKNLRARS
ncbi:unnamed protein product [Ilex paraguariensis]|uniref:non-specific serine/threonine protein kinase n=1 Tax=Ilex paraguariensis TaxID=185542 RepID=A0ABC8RLU9_9AQUA